MATVFSVKINGISTIIKNFQELNDAVADVQKSLDGLDFGTSDYKELSKALATLQQNKKSFIAEAKAEYEQNKLVKNSINALKSELNELEKAYQSFNKTQQKGRLGKDNIAERKRIQEELNTIAKTQQKGLGKSFSELGSLTTSKDLKTLRSNIVEAFNALDPKKQATSLDRYAKQLIAIEGKLKDIDKINDRALELKATPLEAAERKLERLGKEFLALSERDKNSQVGKTMLNNYRAASVELVKQEQHAKVLKSILNDVRNPKTIATPTDLEAASAALDKIAKQYLALSENDKNSQIGQTMLGNYTQASKELLKQEKYANNLKNILKELRNPNVPIDPNSKQGLAAAREQLVGQFNSLSEADKEANLNNYIAQLNLIENKLRELGRLQREAEFFNSTPIEQARIQLDRLKEEYLRLSRTEKDSPLGKQTLENYKKANEQLKIEESYLKRLTDIEDKRLNKNQKQSNIQGLVANVSNFVPNIGNVLGNEGGEIFGRGFQSLFDAGGTLAATGANPLVLLGLLAKTTIETYAELIKVTAQVEDEQALLAKSTNRSIGSIKDLTEELAGIDTKTGLVDLLKEGQGLGQLGFDGFKLDATTIASVDKLTVALSDEFGTNVKGIVTTMGSLRQVLKDIQTDNFGQDILRLGNAVNVLGQEGIATAPVIADFVSRMAATGTQLGIPTKALLGVAATLQELGVTAERGSSGFNRFVSKMVSNSEGFSKTLRITSQDVKNLGTGFDSFDSLLAGDTFGALTLVIRKFKELNLNSIDYIKTLKEIGIRNITDREVIGKLIGSYDLLAAKVARAGESLQNTNSITKEFNTINTTLGAELAKLGNTIQYQFLNSDFGNTVKGWAVAINNMLKPTQELNGELTKETSQLTTLVSRVLQAAQGTRERTAAIAALRKDYPEFLKDINLEIISNDNLVYSLDDVIAKMKLKNLEMLKIKKTQDLIFSRDNAQVTAVQAQQVLIKSLEDLNLRLRSSAYGIKTAERVGLTNEDFTGLEDIEKLKQVALKAREAEQQINGLSIRGKNSVANALLEFNRATSAVKTSEKVVKENAETASKSIEKIFKSGISGYKDLDSFAKAYEGQVADFAKQNIKLSKQALEAKTDKQRQKVIADFKALTDKITTFEEQQFKITSAIDNFGSATNNDVAKQLVEKKQALNGLLGQLKQIKLSLSGDAIEGVSLDPSILNDIVTGSGGDLGKKRTKVFDEEDLRDARKEIEKYYKGISEYELEVRRKIENFNVDAYNTEYGNALLQLQNNLNKELDDAKKLADDEYTRKKEIIDDLEKKLRELESDRDSLKPKEVSKSIKAGNEYKAQIEKLKKELESFNKGTTDVDKLSIAARKKYLSDLGLLNKEQAEKDRQFLLNFQQGNLEILQKSLQDDINLIESNFTGLNAQLSDDNEDLLFELEGLLDKTRTTVERTKLEADVQLKIKLGEIDLDEKELIAKKQAIEKTISNAVAQNQQVTKAGGTDLPFSDTDITELTKQLNGVNNAITKIERKRLVANREYKRKVLKAEGDDEREIRAEIFSALNKVAQQGVETYFSIQKAALDREAAYRSQLLEKDTSARLEGARGNAIEIAKIEKAAAAEREALERAEAKRRYELTLKQAIAQAAFAVITELATPNINPIVKGIRVAATIAAGALQVAAIKANGYAEGGYTPKSPFRPDHTGEKPVGVVHEDEYVVPKRVLRTKQGKELVHKLERMRKGVGYRRDELAVSKISKSYAVGGSVTKEKVTVELSSKSIEDLANRVGQSNEQGAYRGITKANTVNEINKYIPKTI